MKDNLKELYENLEKEAKNITILTPKETQEMHDRINKKMGVVSRDFREIHSRSQIEASKTILST